MKIMFDDLLSVNAKKCPIKTLVHISNTGSIVFVCCGCNRIAASSMKPNNTKKLR